VGSLGQLYMGVAALLGAWYVAAALRVRATNAPGSARALFRRSIVYLTLLFGAIALDPLLPVRLG